MVEARKQEFERTVFEPMLFEGLEDNVPELRMLIAKEDDGPSGLSVERGGRVFSGILDDLLDSGLGDAGREGFAEGVDRSPRGEGGEEGGGRGRHGVGAEQGLLDEWDVGEEETAKGEERRKHLIATEIKKELVFAISGAADESIQRGTLLSKLYRRVPLVVT